MIKVGDKVRLTGEDWETSYDELSHGDVVEIIEIDHDGIWAAVAGTVGRYGELYSASNPEGSGDYSCELVSGNSEEATRNSRDIFAETVAKLTVPAVSKEEIEDVHTLGEQLGLSSFEQNVHRILGGVGDTIVAKNLSYGDSALNPIRVFSKADRTEQLYTRLDDKLSRVQKGHEYPGDDTIRDIIGYCTLILIAREGE